MSAPSFGRVIERFLRDPAFEIVLSPAIVEETLRALAYPKVRKYVRRTPDPELWFEDIVLLAELVAGDYAVSDASTEPDDRDRGRAPRGLTAPEGFPQGLSENRSPPNAPRPRNPVRTRRVHQSTGTRR
jgi:hypothetical protein